jgi:hypothetical protein
VTPALTALERTATRPDVFKIDGRKTPTRAAAPRRKSWEEKRGTRKEGNSSKPDSYSPAPLRQGTEKKRSKNLTAEMCNCSNFSNVVAYKNFIRKKFCDLALIYREIAHGVLTHKR